MADILQTLSPDVREVCLQAQEIGGEDIRSEHLLQALLDNPGCLAMFSALGVSPRDVREDLEAALQIPFGKKGKRKKRAPHQEFREILKHAKKRADKGKRKEMSLEDVLYGVLKLRGYRERGARALKNHMGIRDLISLAKGRLRKREA